MARQASLSHLLVSNFSSLAYISLGNRQTRHFPGLRSTCVHFDVFWASVDILTARYTSVNCPFVGSTILERPNHDSHADSHEIKSVENCKISDNGADLVKTTTYVLSRSTHTRFDLTRTCINVKHRMRRLEQRPCLISSFVNRTSQSVPVLRIADPHSAYSPWL